MARYRLSKTARFLVSSNTDEALWIPSAPSCPRIGDGVIVHSMAPGLWASSFSQSGTSWPLAAGIV